MLCIPCADFTRKGTESACLSFVHVRFFYYGTDFKTILFQKFYWTLCFRIKKGRFLFTKCIKKPVLLSFPPLSLFLYLFLAKKQKGYDFNTIFLLGDTKFYWTFLKCFHLLIFLFCCIFQNKGTHFFIVNDSVEADPCVFAFHKTTMI